MAFQAFSGLPGQQQQQRHAAGATSQAVAVTLQAGMMQAAQGTGSFPAATPGGGLLASGPCPYNNPLPTGVQGAVSAALANPVMPTARPITSEALPTVPATTAHGAAAAAAIAGWSVPSAHPNLQAGGAAVMAAAALAHANGSMGTVNGSILGSRAALPATTLGAPEVTLLPGSMLHANQHQMLHDMLQRLRRRQQQQQQQQQQESLVQAAPAAHGQPQSSSVTQPGGNQQAALLSVPLPSPLQQQQQHQHQPKVQDHVQQQLQHSSQVVTTNQAASIHGEWPEYQLLPAQRHRQIPAQMHPPPVHAAADAGTMRASLSGSAGADLAKVPPAVVDVAAPAFTTGVAASFERGTVQAGLAGIDRTSRSSDLTEASSSVATCLRKGAGWQQRVASVPTASEAGRSGRPSDGQVMREDSDSGSSADMLTGILDEYGAGLLQTLSDALVGPVGPSNAQALQSGAQDVPMLVTISPAMFRHRSSDFVGYTSDAQRAAGHQAQHAPRFPDINSSEDSDGDGGGSDAGLTPESERLERAWPPDLPAAQLQAQVQPQEGDGSSDADCEGQRGTFGREGDDTAAADLHRAQPRAAETAGLGNCLSPLEGLARHTRLTYHAASADRHQASTYLATGGLNGSQLGAGDGERVSCASDQQGTPSEGGSRRQHSGRSVRAISMQHRRLAALCSAAECIGVGGRSWGGSPHRSDAPQRRRAGSVDAPGPRRRRLSDSEAIHVSRQELAMATQAVAAMLLCPAADQAEEQV